MKQQKTGKAGRSYWMYMLGQEGYVYLISHELVQSLCVAKHRVLGAGPIEATDDENQERNVYNVWI